MHTHTYTHTYAKESVDTFMEAGIFFESLSEDIVVLVAFVWRLQGSQWPKFQSKV